MITKADFEKVLNYIKATTPQSFEETKRYELLRMKLVNSVVCENHELPETYIGLGSPFALIMPFGLVNNIKLVLPAEVNNETHQLSVFSNLGIAVIGNKIGDKIDYCLSLKKEFAEITNVLKPKKKKYARK